MKTAASRERDLRDGLRRATTTVEQKTLTGKTLAYVNDEGPINIVIDPARGGLIESVVHELVHRVWARPLRMWGDAEETLVIALEQDVMYHINAKPSRVRWWRQAIAKKLAQGAE